MPQPTRRHADAPFLRRFAHSPTALRCVAQDATNNVDATLSPDRVAELKSGGGGGGADYGCGNGSTFPDCRDPTIPKTEGYPPNAGPCGNDSISIDCGEAMDAGAPQRGHPQHAPGWQNGCTEDDPCPAGGARHGPKEGRGSP